MDKQDFFKIIFDALEMVNHLREDSEKIEISEDTNIFGTSGTLDSMSLVSFLIDVEESLLDAGFEISLSDDRAMSQSSSPFLNVQTLTAYIENLIESPNSRG
jgi:acyl carrier protein